MLFNILHNHFIRDIPGRCHKISSRPYVTPLKCPTQCLELHHHPSRTLTLDILHQLAGRNMWGDRYHHMHMIFGNMPLQDLHIKTSAYLPDQLANPFGYLSFLNWLDLPPKKWTHGKEIYALSCSYFSGDTYPNWECNLFRL